MHEKESIVHMRAACELAARVLDYAGTLVKGYHGDTSKTFLCGEVDEAGKQLVKVTEECLLRGISTCKHGTSFKKIGRRISEHAERNGFCVVECFVGHGVGRVFHSEPLIYHQRNNRPGQMIEGQTFTIEPIISMGSIDCDMWDDGWTAVTTDGSLTVQFEHTILITRTGAEILTKC
ncbi:methionine aminopeptidase 1B, chloroplastic-like isoform X1 [Miscanthus floridulus]|uniref:methionine aminopeptidase 1B, chloroplastic-like isoform X1 n=1 Tax=Miscanthus floridulus TaxID=154761 RepID=UPI00345A6696